MAIAYSSKIATPLKIAGLLKEIMMCLLSTKITLKSGASLHQCLAKFGRYTILDRKQQFNKSSR